MPCRPVSVSLEVNPSPEQKILFTLDKTCDARDQAIWKMTFELREGKPLAPVVRLTVQIDPENNAAAEATAKTGLDENQQGQAQIAAAVVKDPTSTPDDRNAALQQVVASKSTPADAASAGL